MEISQTSRQSGNIFSLNKKTIEESNIIELFLNFSFEGIQPELKLLCCSPLFVFLITVDIIIQIGSQSDKTVLLKRKYPLPGVGVGTWICSEQRDGRHCCD